MTDSGDPRDLDGSEDSKCPHCKSKCSDATECGMNMIADADIETPYYDKAEVSEGGDSSSTVKGDSHSLSNGGEPPTPSEHELPEMPTAEDVMILVCDNCGDIVKPKYAETLTDMMDSLCLECTEGNLKVEETELVRRVDAEDQILELNARWANRLEDAVKKERSRMIKYLDDTVGAVNNLRDRILEHGLDSEEYPVKRCKEIEKNLREKAEELRGEAENQNQDTVSTS